MTSLFFTYSKPKVLQALRYHFITRKEIKFIVILVNLFAIVAATFYYFKKVSAYVFLGSSCLWFCLMISFWYVLPNVIYRKSKTFKDRLKVSFEQQHMFIENDGGSRSWPWTAFSSMIESPYFFHLYFDSRSFFIIPKDAFEPDKISEVRKILKEKIKPDG
ncbi:YcxB family protein [Ginsengibacter hankyongi]|uniref:YcxB family protein n=1 Tax=Ginsengibacter hankyongi TaxID=2607284 RepID=A0A5J5IGD7_9BACT|nr:YcxB family protein [Ginsengibacter hankyongi]KAA9039330.1 YcxB family protein [Ginsengibacter hankyongi]